MHITWNQQLVSQALCSIPWIGLRLTPYRLQAFRRSSRSSVTVHVCPFAYFLWGRQPASRVFIDGPYGYVMITLDHINAPTAIVRCYFWGTLFCRKDKGSHQNDKNLSVITRRMRLECRRTPQRVHISNLSFRDLLSSDASHRLVSAFTRDTS